ncbi:SCAN domain-containing protein 1 [Alligator mississippiensis]|uniref:SCAN domain-containing protein 1 n=1 Tax=Alligator mississippiensis TaxID=8496 RepID=UPI002877AABD|nr:SCAN domain-containing protein 1 [Alligator mississippiensis]XP_059585307.1 SCAN domain-containing protein 1 [Alligator mississippiensis]XP_059585308.1 SCAN domain-containing protein 1 [Alligator mississippiensis]XP_059585309.1 SCAN domain-containing protein 1 [Alligator mississippiensis]XP_059585310.1 SCAN domain-containing protein 1 [Alligator mississippiensis]XP_059585311.1 SCAN domain-containing protein 1 [Alligator mississippiensis]XP_059585312.1 SCAN domain-containing protein 1 [Alli
MGDGHVRRWGWALWLGVSGASPVPTALKDDPDAALSGDSRGASAGAGSRSWSPTCSDLHAASFPAALQLWQARAQAQSSESPGPGGEASPGADSGCAGARGSAALPAAALLQPEVTPEEQAPGAPGRTSPSCRPDWHRGRCQGAAGATYHPAAAGGAGAAREMRGQAVMQAMQPPSGAGSPRDPPAGAGAELPGPEPWRQRFRGLRYRDAPGLREVCRRLQELCRGWLEPQRRSKEQVLELVVLEQFLAILPPGMRSWEWGRSVQTCAQAVALAEGFQRGLEEDQTLQKTVPTSMWLRGVASQPHLSQILALH